MVDHLLWGGTIRKLWPTEATKFRDHLSRLDSDNRRLRFGHAVSEAFLDEYAARLPVTGGIVFAYFIDGHVRAAAELRKLTPMWEEEAEAAFSVEKIYQNQGIGSELMGHVIRSARNRRVRRLWMSCLAENAQMRALARRHQAHLEFALGDVVGEITPEGPDVFSLAGEALEDRFGFVLAVMDLGDGFNRAA